MFTATASAVTPADAGEAAAEEGDAFARERLRHVFDNSPVGVAVNSALALLLIVLLWPSVSHLLLVGWALALNLAGALRLHLRTRYFATSGASAAGRGWAVAFILVVALTAALWGGGTLVLVQQAAPDAQFLLVLVLAGLCAGGIVHLAPLFAAYLVYVPLLLAPMTLWCLHHAPGPFRTLGFMTIVFGAALLSTARHYSRHFNRALELAAALAASEHRLRRIIDLVPAQIFARDRAGAYLLANKAAARFRGVAVADVLAGAVQASALEQRGDADFFAAGGGERTEEFTLPAADGEPRTLRTSRVAFTDPVSGTRGVLGVAMDITDERRALDALRESEARFVAAFRDAPIGMLLVDVEGRVQNANDAARAILDDALEGNAPFWSTTLDHADELARRFHGLTVGAPFTLEVRFQRAGAAPCWTRLSAAAVPPAPGGRVRAIVQIEDITAARVMAAQIAYHAAHDGLTGLLNRAECEKRLAEALASPSVDGVCHALLHLNIDKFKLVNDTGGRDAGDALLREVGGLLRKALRRHDVVARLGGDEFAVILEHCQRDQVQIIADKLGRLLAGHRFAWHGQVINPGCSIGIVYLDRDVGDVGGALQAGEAACEAARARGGHRSVVFAADDADLSRHRLQVDSVAAITRALEHDGLELHAQAIRPAQGEAGLHFEVLVRMRDESGATISPGVFLPAAERYGLAPRIDRWVIEHVCALFAARPAALERLELCSINLSGQSLTDPELAGFIDAAFRARGLPPARFCFEITETAVIAGIDQARRFIDVLHGRGFRFALDDFGSGLSSFGYLKALPVDILKIDGVFVRNLAVDAADEAMVRAISEVAHLLGKVTVAEFVESAEQMARLAQIGVDYLQGYHVGRPRPLAEILDEATAPALARSA